MGTIWHHLPAHSSFGLGRKEGLQSEMSGQGENEWDGEKWGEHMWVEGKEDVARGGCNSCDSRYINTWSIYTHRDASYLS